MVRAYCLAGPKDNSSIVEGVLPNGVTYRSNHNGESWDNYRAHLNGWTFETASKSKPADLVVRYNAFRDILVIEEEKFVIKYVTLVSRKEFSSSEENEAIAYLRSLR